MSWNNDDPTTELQVYRLRASTATKRQLDAVSSELKRRGLTRVTSPTGALSFAMHCAALALGIEKNGGRS